MGCPLAMLSPASGTSGPVAEVFARITGNGGFGITGTGPARFVTFNSLQGGQSYTITAEALGKITYSLPSGIALPDGKPASACLSARYNTTGGITYHATYVIGLSPPPPNACP
jgi:hypothetical protein